MTVKEVRWETPFTTVKWLMCDDISSDGETELVVLLTEYHVFGAIHDARSEDPVDKLLETVSPVQETPWSRKWKVIFQEAVAVKLTREGFEKLYNQPRKRKPYEIPPRSVIIEDSPWIKELDYGGMLDAMYPGCRHYSIYTQLTAIEVLSPKIPIVELISRPEKNS